MIEEEVRNSVKGEGNLCCIIIIWVILMILVCILMEMRGIRGF